MYSFFLTDYSRAGTKCDAIGTLRGKEQIAESKGQQSEIF